MPARHWERHVNGRIGWLRAAILSANDGILSFQQRVWCSASQPRIRVTATYWGRDRRTGAWLCRWLPVSTYRSTHRQTPNRLNSSASVWNSERTTRASTRNWRRSTSLAGSIHRPREAGSHATDGARMPATNSASLRLSLRVRFRLH